MSTQIKSAIFSVHRNDVAWEDGKLEQTGSKDSFLLAGFDQETKTPIGMVSGLILPHKNLKGAIKKAAPGMEYIVEPLCNEDGSFNQPYCLWGTSVVVALAAEVHPAYEDAGGKECLLDAMPEVLSRYIPGIVGILTPALPWRTILPGETRTPEFWEESQRIAELCEQHGFQRLESDILLMYRPLMAV